MSRRRKAIIIAVFTYGQNVVAMLLGLAVTRVVLHRLGRDVYGLWIASGALLAYAGFADLGVLGVLPWMVAEADGKKDTEATRALVAHGLLFAVAAGFAFGALAGGLWYFYPTLLRLTAEDRSLLAWPLFLTVALTALTFPFRTFSALLAGKQDSTYLGISGVLQVTASAVVTLFLVTRGAGLFALAFGASAPPLLAGIAALVRARSQYANVVTPWLHVDSKLVRRLAIDGFGAWMVSFGYTMAAASDPIILSFVGLRGLVPGFAMSTRLGLTLTQFAWILPDAALVGLAQLNAEGTKERVREICTAIILLNLIVGGAVASAILASNGTFVRLWVGSDYFLGLRFNALVAINAILSCFLHGISTVVSVLGRRFEMGVALLINGILHALLATLLSRHLGPYGIILATLISGAATCLPTALGYLPSTLETSIFPMLRKTLTSWASRFLPLAGCAGLMGYVLRSQWLPTVVVSCAIFGVAYVWWMRPLYRHVPLGSRLTELFRRFRLL